MTNELIKDPKASVDFDNATREFVVATTLFAKAMANGDDRDAVIAAATEWHNAFFKPYYIWQNNNKWDNHFSTPTKYDFETIGVFSNRIAVISNRHTGCALWSVARRVYDIDADIFNDLML